MADLRPSDHLELLDYRRVCDQGRWYAAEPTPRERGELRAHVGTGLSPVRLGGSRRATARYRRPRQDSNLRPDEQTVCTYGEAPPSLCVSPSCDDFANSFPADTDR